MAEFDLRIDSLDLAPYLRAQPGEGFDPHDGDYLEPAFADSPLRDGGALINMDARNREMVWPLVLSPRQPISTTVYTNLVPNPSGENDTQNWVADSGETITRVTGVVPYGSAAIQCVNTADTFGRIRSGTALSTAQPVSGGDTVFGRGRINPVSVGAGTVSNVTLSARFYDAAGAAVGADLSFDSIASPTLNDWHALEGSVTAPATAVEMVILASITVSVSTTITWYVDAMMLCITDDTPSYFDGDTPGFEWVGVPHLSASTGTPVPINLIRNPSGEVNTTDWDISATAGATVEGPTRTDEWSKHGDYSIYTKIVNPDTTSRTISFRNGATVSNGFRITEGKFYFVSWEVNILQAPQSIEADVVCFNSAGSTVSSPTVTFITSTGERRISAVITAPAGAVGCYLRLTMLLNEENETFECYADNLMLVEVPSTSWSMDYFDGDSLDGEWVGTEHLSSSGALVGKDGLLEMARRVNRQIASGEVVRWRDDGASHHTYYSLVTGRLDVDFNFFRARALHIYATLHLWVKPYGHTNTTAVAATAAATGALMAASPMPTVIGGDTDALTKWTVTTGSVVTGPQGRIVGAAVVGASYVARFPAASFGNLMTGATLTGASGVSGSQMLRVPMSPTQSEKMFDITLPLPANYAGNNRVFAVMKAQSVAFRAMVHAVDPFGVAIGPTQMATSMADFALVDLGVLRMPSLTAAMPSQAKVSIFSGGYAPSYNSFFFAGNEMLVTDVFVVPDDKFTMVYDREPNVLSYDDFEKPVAVAASYHGQQYGENILGRVDPYSGLVWATSGAAIASNSLDGMWRETNQGWIAAPSAPQTADAVMASLITQDVLLTSHGRIGAQHPSISHGLVKIIGPSVWVEARLGIGNPTLGYLDIRMQNASLAPTSIACQGFNPASIVATQPAGLQTAINYRLRMFIRAGNVWATVEPAFHGSKMWMVGGSRLHFASVGASHAFFALHGLPGLRTRGNTGAGNPFVTIYDFETCALPSISRLGPQDAYILDGVEDAAYRTSAGGTDAVEHLGNRQRGRTPMIEPNEGKRIVTFVIPDGMTSDFHSSRVDVREQFMFAR